MKKRIKNTACIIIIVLLFCLIFSVANENSESGSKEVQLGKQFLNKLIENNIIDELGDKALNFKVEEKKDKTEGDIPSYILNSDELAIEMDKDGHVVKFVNKISKGEVKSVTKEDAIKLAEKYIKILSPGDYRFDKVTEETLKDEIKYYSIRFKKYDENYPYYSLDAILNINKSTGKLEGYVNHYGKTEHEPIEINIKKEDAKEKALESFNSVMKFGEVVDDVNLAYGHGKENGDKLHLCYVVKVKGNDYENVEKEVVYFISAKTGEVINSFNNSVEKIKIK